MSSGSSPDKLKQEYELHFEQEINRLNPAQAEAVSQIDGPVLVIAGPGTGKTHILSARIGRILRDTDAQAANILCLTFTDAGVQAMRQRLLQLIGPEAHRVHIYTFHSFCNGIIQDNMQQFGRAELEPISELERVELIRRILDLLPPDHSLRRGRPDVYFYERPLRDLFQRMKSEHWTVQTIEEAAKNYLDSLPDRPDYRYKLSRGDFKKGDLKTGKFDQEKERMDRLVAAARLFPKYGSALAKARRYDYDDMLIWVLDAFRQNPMLLRVYQEQYLYLLVDEYQDTNGAQNELLQFLTSYWDQPNIFIVGDDDQSIFEFQGARLRNLVDFYKNYESTIAVVLLQQNYRSSQNILDSSAKLIQHNEKRILNHLAHLNIEKKLQAASTEISNTPSQLAVYPNRILEELAIIEQVEKWKEEGIPLSEMSVIYARHKQVDHLLELLDKKNIPYQTKRNINILDLPQVRQIRLLLTYFREEYKRPFGGEAILFQVLHFRAMGVSSADLALLSAYRASFSYAERPHLRKLVSDKKIIHSLSLAKPEALLAAGQILEEIYRDFTEWSVPALVEKIINRIGFLQQALQADDALWKVQILRALIDFIKKETERRPRLQVEQLLDTFDRMDQNRLPLSLYKNIERKEGLQLLSAHSAKGLEFRCVWIMDCVSDYWEPSRRSGFSQFYFPDTLTLSGEEDALESRRRLLFVAMTRAKEHLIMSYAEQRNDGKKLSPSQFIDELLSQEALTKIETKSHTHDPLAIELLQLQETTVAGSPALEKEQIELLLVDFRMSVSALNRYLRCPLAFYYQHVLRAPSVQSEEASYGLAMHNALQTYFDKMLADEQHRFTSENDLLRRFEIELRQVRGYFSEDSFERRLEQGRQYLGAYYRTHRSSWPKSVRTELMVRNVEFKGVPLTGMIDRLDLNKEGEAYIVDYKTGSHSATRMRKPTPKNPIGGSYWRQLLFYKILYESQQGLSRIVKSGKISYLEPATDGQYIEKSIKYRPADIELVQQLIVDTYANIQAHNFYDGCGEDYCIWCRLTRDQELPNSLSIPEIEDLDDRT